MNNILYMSLTLTRGRIERDVAKIKALQRNPEGAGWFSSVILKVPSWQEFPHALDMPVAQYALEVLRELRMPFYWARNLWISHPDPDGIPLTGPLSHLMPEHYAAAIGWLRAEEQRLRAYGCIGCGFDFECYGKDNPQGATLAGRKWDIPEERNQLRGIIQRAVNVTGFVDLAMPYGHRTRDYSYDWCFGPLADRHISEMPTYYALTPEEVVVNAPLEHPFKPTIRGIHVGRADGKNNFPNLTEEDVKGVDLAAWVAAYPLLEDTMVYIDHDKWPEVIGGWSA